MVKSTRSNDVRAFFAPFMVGDPSNKTSPNKFKHEVSDKQNVRKTSLFDLKGREEIVRDILDISQSVDQARLRLTRTEFDRQENGRLSRVFVQGALFPAGRLDRVKEITLTLFFPEIMAKEWQRFFTKILTIHPLREDIISIFVQWQMMARGW